MATVESKQSILDSLAYNEAVCKYTNGGCGVFALAMYKHVKQFNWCWLQMCCFGHHSILISDDGIWALDIHGLELTDDKVERHVYGKDKHDYDEDCLYLDKESDIQALKEHTKNYIIPMPDDLINYIPDRNTEFWANQIFKAAKEKHPQLFK